MIFSIDKQPKIIIKLHVCFPLILAIFVNLINDYNSDHNPSEGWQYWWKMFFARSKLSWTKIDFMMGFFLLFFYFSHNHTCKIRIVIYKLYKLYNMYINDDLRKFGAHSPLTNYLIEYAMYLLHCSKYYVMCFVRRYLHGWNSEIPFLWRSEIISLTFIIRAI